MQAVNVTLRKQNSKNCLTIEKQIQFQENGIEER